VAPVFGFVESREKVRDIKTVDPLPLSPTAIRELARLLVFGSYILPNVEVYASI